MGISLEIDGWISGLWTLQHFSPTATPENRCIKSKNRFLFFLKRFWTCGSLRRCLMIVQRFSVKFATAFQNRFSWLNAQRFYWFSLATDTQGFPYVTGVKRCIITLKGYNYKTVFVGLSKTFSKALQKPLSNIYEHGFLTVVKCFQIITQLFDYDWISYNILCN